LVHDDEALLGEHEAVVRLQALDVVTGQTLPRTQVANTTRQGGKLAVIEDDVELWSVFERTAS
jgi:hypothetical protein